MILGKSCKLIPVMLMNVVLYRRSFPFHKYLVVAMVTFGISVFTLFAPVAAHKKGKGVENSSLFGLGLLLASLAVDGATNSTQDEVFARFRISGSQMMLFMNTFATLLTFTVLLFPIPSFPSLGVTGTGTSEWSTALAFVRAHPAVWKDVLAYALAGAIGQLFIFDTLEHFGSLTLVTVTVTRKLFTMLLSVVVYKHRLAPLQWIGVALVFAGIGLEAQVKRKGGLRKAVLLDEGQKARLKAV
jgi:UDP-galactose transporter B1